jgi:hypothetical protein
VTGRPVVNYRSRGLTRRSVKAMSPAGQQVVGQTAVATATCAVLGSVFGVLMGLFGVFNSVFSDGPIIERLVLIGVILALYAIVGGLLGLLGPRQGWRWEVLLAAPGAAALLLMLMLEAVDFTGQDTYDPQRPGPWESVLYVVLLLLYAALLPAAACLGAWAGATLRSRKG